MRGLGQESRRVRGRGVQAIAGWIRFLPEADRGGESAVVQEVPQDVGLRRPAVVAFGERAVNEGLDDHVALAVEGGGIRSEEAEKEGGAGCAGRCLERPARLPLHRKATIKQLQCGGGEAIPRSQEEKTIMRIRLTLAVSTLAGLLLTAPAPGQAPGESFTATASVKSDAVTGTVPVTIVIKHWATDAERAKVMKALHDGGSKAAKAVLAKMRDSGTLELAKTKGAIKYAYARSTGSGRIVTVVTAKPLYHLGGGLPDAKPKAGYDLAIALLVLEADGTGHGELSPAAKVSADDSGAIVVDDYGEAKIWLKGIANKK